MASSHLTQCLLKSSDWGGWPGCGLGKGPKAVFSSLFCFHILLYNLRPFPTFFKFCFVLFFKLYYRILWLYVGYHFFKTLFACSYATFVIISIHFWNSTNLLAKLLANIVQIALQTFVGIVEYFLMLASHGFGSPRNLSFSISQTILKN